MTDLAAPLRYLIGADNPHPVGDVNYVTECGYDTLTAPQNGRGILYGNLFFEKYADANAATRARYAPYLHTSDIAREYNEGQIDPNGPGWNRNLDEQFESARARGFSIIELDNPDAYHLKDVLGAVDRAWNIGLSVVAKNPLLVEGNNVLYVSHPAVVGCIVEKDAGTCSGMDTLRRAAFKPLLPIWFVSFGAGRAWAQRRAQVIRVNRYPNMGVTWSSQGEYENSVDILMPRVVNSW